MKLSVLKPCQSVVAIALVAIAQPSVAAIKCWTNSEGVRECGNSVPPEYAQGGHVKFNSQGIAVDKTTRAKSKEELETERRHRDQLAMQREKRERALREKAYKDRILLQTFATEEDILLARDGQIGAIESRIAHIRQVMRKIEANIEDLQGAAARAERRGDKPAAKLLGNMENLRKQLAENALSIKRRTKEREQIEAKYARDLERYRELHARR